MVTKKTSGKTADKIKTTKMTAPAAKKPVAVRRTGAVKQGLERKPLPQQPPQKPTGPTAKVCPLVLDGEVDALDFSPRDCFSCSEFDCRFCCAEKGSGTLRSRLFAVDDAGGGGDDDLGGDDDDLVSDDAEEGEEEEEEKAEEELP